jgi:hypothetical protein
MPVAEYDAACDRLRECRAMLGTVFHDVDALLVPAAPGEAPDVATTGDPIFNRVWSALGGPAITVRRASGRRGCLSACSSSAPPGHDARVLACAAWVEKALAPRGARVRADRPRALARLRSFTGDAPLERSHAPPAGSRHETQLREDVESDASRFRSRLHACSRPAASGEGCELVVVNCSECSRRGGTRGSRSPSSGPWWSDGFGALLPFLSGMWPGASSRTRITLAHAAAQGPFRA